MWDEEIYNSIRSDSFKNYSDSHWIPPKNPGGPLLGDQLWGLKPMQHNEDSFWEEIRKDKSFASTWGLSYGKRSLTEEERYNLWFNLNYETGFEKCFDPGKIPDYENPYWEPTPKYVVHINYKSKDYKFYRFS